MDMIKEDGKYLDFAFFFSCSLTMMSSILCLVKQFQMIQTANLGSSYEYEQGPTDSNWKEYSFEMKVQLDLLR